MKTRPARTFVTQADIDAARLEALAARLAAGREVLCPRAWRAWRRRIGQGAAVKSS